MSRDDVDLVGRIYEVMDSDVPATLELLTPDVEWVNPPYAVVAGVRGGHAGWTEVMRELAEAFETWRHDAEAFEELAPGRVLVDLVFRAQGRGSGVALEKPEFHLWTLRDGKGRRCEWFNVREEALRAAAQTGW